MRMRRMRRMRVPDVARIIPAGPGQPHQQAELGMDGAAAADNAGDAVCSEGDESQQHACMDGKVVHALQAHAVHGQS
jgi:hypothetical protein